MSKLPREPVPLSLVFFISLVLLFVLLFPAPAWTQDPLVPVGPPSPSLYLTVGNYQLVTSQRINSTVWQYTYTASITNSSALSWWGVSTTVQSSVPTTVVTSGTLHFGNVGPLATQTSTDTFTLQIDRRYPLQNSNLKWTINSVNCTPDTCHITAGWNPTLGCVFTDIRTPIYLEPSAERLYSVSSDGRITLYEDPTTCAVWNGHWTQNNEPDKDYCGPTAAKNLLDWYGQSLSYSTLGSEMNTNSWMGAVDVATGCCEICSGVFNDVACWLAQWDPACDVACPIILPLCFDVGTLPGDLINTLGRNSPPGYRPYKSTNILPVSDLEYHLQAGDPMIVLLWTGSTLHWDVITGTVDDGAGSVEVTFANDPNMTFDSFVEKWSLRDMNSLEQTIVQQEGIVPYIRFLYEKTTELTAYQEITRGNFITSADGRFELILDAGGNLVLYPLPITCCPYHGFWKSNTAGTDAQTAIMQGDGNFVIYDSSHNPLWATGTNGNPGAYLALQNDGNLVIYASDNVTVLWASNTCCH